MMDEKKKLKLEEPNKPSRVDQIGQMYDKLNQANADRIQAGYDQIKSDAQAAKDKIDPMYQQKANDLAVQYERNRRNFNQQAASRGLNTGAGSQANLAMMGNYQRDYGGLRESQAEAQADAERNLLNIETKAKTEINAALAQGDYAKAAEIMKEHNREQAEKMQQAKILANFGDFSGFEGIYTPDQIKAMSDAWKAQNPQLAYNTGKITADEYHNMTGKFPAGYTPPSSGGGGYPYPGTPNPGTPIPQNSPAESMIGMINRTSDPDRYWAEISNSPEFAGMSQADQIAVAEAAANRNRQTRGYLDR